MGDKIVIDILKKIGFSVTTLDIDTSLTPDIVGSVNEIDKIVKQKYESVLCCQVLEHLPFESFDSIIAKLAQITQQYLIVSLPFQSINLGLKIVFHRFKIPFFLINIQKKYLKWKWDGKHYWEAGTYRKTIKDLKNVFIQYFTVESTFVVKEYPWHIFFVLKKT